MAPARTPGEAGEERGHSGLWQRGCVGIVRSATVTDNMDQLPSLRVLLSGPRGFCAGVDRAIRVVEEAIRRFGAPVYVRHEIVHNRTVVEALEAQGCRVS